MKAQLTLCLVSVIVPKHPLYYKEKNQIKVLLA